MDNARRGARTVVTGALHRVGAVARHRSSRTGRGVLSLRSPVTPASRLHARARRSSTGGMDPSVGSWSTGEVCARERWAARQQR